MFLRAYQGGKAALVPVGLRTVVRDSNGQVVRDLPEALAVGSFDRIARAADHTFELPIGSLVPGAYAVEFVATLSKLSVTRAVTFTVR
jgi:hypothetical protein